MQRTMTVLVLALSLNACSDDNGGTPDTRPAVDLAVVEASVDQGAPDKGADTAVPDSAVPDATESDGPKPAILSFNHTGWGDKGCGKVGCHSLPVANHTASSPPECASCHGANGACDANGTFSSKKNHTAADPCVSCHTGGRHGYTANADCVACHLAAAGLENCQHP